MGRKPHVDRSPEEKWQIVQEGIKSGNVSETCRRHGIAPNLFYRWKDEAERTLAAVWKTAAALPCIAALRAESTRGIFSGYNSLGNCLVKYDGLCNRCAQNATVFEKLAR